MNKKIGICLGLVCIILAGLVLMSQASSSDLSNKLLSPSLIHPFGTDFLGRDMLKRVMSGISLSFLTGIATTAISCLLATLLAFLACSRNKALSTFVDIAVDLTIGIPHIVLLILISFALGGGAIGLIVAIALSHWPALSRVLKNEILSVKVADYYKIEMHMPNSSYRTSAKLILPAIAPQLLTGALLCFPHAILHESTLTFLGFGYSAETPALGVILSESLSYLTAGYWWVGLLPGMSLAALVLLVRYISSQILLNRHSTSEKKVNIDNLVVKGGEFVSLVGQSGAGKTTLAEQIFKSLKKGQASFIPQNITALDPTFQYSFKGRSCYPSELSGGEARQVLIDDSLSKDSTLIIADEPCNGLDSLSATKIVAKLQSLVSNDCCVLMITHDLKLALTSSDRVLLLENNQILEDENSIYSLLECRPKNIELPHKISHDFIKSITFNDVAVSMNSTKIFDCITATFKSNERVCIFGDSGCGKTTLAKIIAGFLKPDSGVIDRGNLNIQYVGQDPYSAFSPYIKIDGKLASEYSGGELQRLAIARALKSLPDFIILDEATSMLDLLAQKEIFEEVLLYCSSNNCGLIFITHDCELRDRVADRVIHL